MNNSFGVFDFKKKILKPLAKIMPLSKLRIAFLRMCGYSIGRDVFIGEDMIISDNLHDKNVFIGDRASIAPRVTLVTSSGPNLSRIEPYVKVINGGKIIIENDAWIGAGAIILPNVTIGAGAIIGAGAVVIEHVPPHTVAVGIPAKVIKKLGLKK